MDLPGGNTVFVGQVPRDLTERDLRAFMEECGRVSNINMLIDRSTGQFKGCAFVTFETSDAATHAKETMHDQRRLPGGTNPMQVTTARTKSGGHGGSAPPSGGSFAHAPPDSRPDKHQPRKKLFVGMLARSLSDEDLRQMFLPFGDVGDSVILRNPDKTSKGCAFITMGDMESCQKAIVALNNSQTFSGCSGPMVVKFADTQAQKESRHRVHMPVPPPPMHSMPPMKPGGMPGMPPPPPGPGHMASLGAYNGPPPPAPVGPPSLGGSGGGDLSALQNLLAPTMAQVLMKQQQELQQQQSTINQALQMLGIPTGPTAPSASSTAATGRGDYSVPGTDPLSGYGASASSMTGYEASAGVAAPGGYRTGPEGANLFIYHLAGNVTESDLHQLFSAYGGVISARVYCDRATGLSKGFGFVSYDNPQSAQDAIEALNGYVMNGRRIKVQPKKGRETAKPY